jgi:hypothetical protein
MRQRRRSLEVSPVTDSVWIALCGALPGFAVGLGTIFQVRRVHVLVNSQKDALQKLLREALITIEKMQILARSKDQTIDQLRDTLHQTGVTPAKEPR